MTLGYQSLTIYIDNILIAKPQAKYHRCHFDKEHFSYWAYNDDDDEIAYFSVLYKTRKL